MNYGYSKPEIEKPKPTKAERRTILHLEARSHANTLEALAGDHRRINANGTIPDAMEKAAKFLRALTT
jgi:hypothetical protein